MARNALPIRFLECGQFCLCFLGEQFAIFVTFGGESIVNVKCPHESLVGVSPGFNCVDGVSLPGSIAGVGQDLPTSFWVAGFVRNGRDIVFSTGMELLEDIGNQGSNRERYNDGSHLGGNVFEELSGAVSDSMSV